MDFDHYKAYGVEDFILDETFIKLSKGNEVEGKTLDQLRSHFPEKRKEISMAVDILKELNTNKKSLPIDRKIAILGRIHSARSRQMSLTLFRYAASVLLVVGLGISLHYFFGQPADIEHFASSSVVSSGKAELILADGERIEIDSKHSTIEYTADGATVSLNDTSKVEQTKPVSGESFNQVTVPYGKRSYILLSDGSRVWLNSGSRLVYPPVFGRNVREVFLEGEACFEVSKNQSRPFFVRTDAFRVKVLGTKFLVQAYAKEKEYHAVLIEGKVSLARKGKLFTKEYELLPSQKATLTANREADFTITEVTHVENSISWIYGYLNFEEEDIVSLSKRISRYYNISIEVRTKNVESKFSGKLDLKDSPERILDGLSTIFKTKYEKQGDKFVFYE